MAVNDPGFMGLEALEGRQLMSATPVGNDTVSAPEVTAAVTVGATPHQNHLHHLHVVHREHHHHLTHLHALHRQHMHRLHLHVLHRQHLHRAHLHHNHHKHALHTRHVQHVLNTTEPKPLHLTAQERNDWPEIRKQVLANQGRV